MTQPSEGQRLQQQLFELEEELRSELCRAHLYAAEPNTWYLRDVIKRILLVLTKG